MRSESDPERGLNSKTRQNTNSTARLEAIGILSYKILLAWQSLALKERTDRGEVERRADSSRAIKKDVMTTFDTKVTILVEKLTERKPVQHRDIMGYIICCFELHECSKAA